MELIGENHRQFWVPAGFAHRFYVLRDSADVLYNYVPQHERSLAWNDATVSVRRPLACTPYGGCGGLGWASHGVRRLRLSGGFVPGLADADTVCG